MQNKDISNKALDEKGPVPSFGNVSDACNSAESEIHEFSIEAAVNTESAVPGVGDVKTESGKTKEPGQAITKAKINAADTAPGTGKMKDGAKANNGNLSIEEEKKNSKESCLKEKCPDKIQHASELSEEQISAIRKYTGEDHYRNINSSLRGMDTLTPENQEIVETMRSALGNSSLPEDMTLYRGTSTAALGTLKDLPPDELIGKTFTEKAFMSTSTNADVADNFHDDMLMTIEAPQGTKALDIATISVLPKESEVLFNDGQEMMITSAESKNGVLHITVIAK